MHDFLRFDDKPLKVKFLAFFLPLILVAVAAAGLSSWVFAESRLKATATRLLGDSTSQTARFVSERFATMFEELYGLENAPSLGNLILNRYPSVGPARYLDIIALNDRIDALLLRYPESIDSIYIKLDNGFESARINEIAPMKIGLDLASWARTYPWEARGYYWLGDHEDRVFMTGDPRRVISCFRMLGSPTSRVHGIVLFNLRSSYFGAFLREEGIGEHGYMALVDSSGIYSPTQSADRYSLDARSLAVVQGLRDAEPGARTLKSSTGEMLFTVNSPVSVNHWQVVTVVPLVDLFGETNRVRAFSFLAVCVLAAISAFLAVVFAGSLSSSIVYLSRQVQKVEAGDFDTEFAVSGGNEIGVLADGLTSLETTVKSLIAKVREEQETKRMAELSALQAQINPHFLCNTLTSIRHLVDMGDARAASAMVSSLEIFFLIGVSRGKDTIRVSEELDHARSYLLIQQMRYAEDFAYEFDVDAEILPCWIMKLTLQPLIENAIYHGIKNRERKGLIKISGHREGQVAALEVYDDGPGISPEALAHLLGAMRAEKVEESPITYGLRNVDERIRLRFGQEYGLDIASLEGSWTRVRVILPFDGVENGN